MERESAPLWRRILSHRTTPSLISAVLLCAIIWILVTDGQRPAQPKTNLPDLAEWTQKIKDNPKEAYNEFKKEYADSTFNIQHEAAHIVGALLYTTLGNSGIAICDQSFAFGCYHGFFGRVIADKGPGIVPELADSCRKQFGKNNSSGCEHGIGHGIMEYTGRGDLLEGLSWCKKTQQLNPLYGCTSGLFMEYNNAIAFTKKGIVPDQRIMDPKNPLAPCNTVVPQEFRASCYFEIALWWKGVFGKEYEKIGNLCAQADTQKERDFCYEGWGTVLAENVNHNPDNGRTDCKLIHDPHGADVCTFGMASRFFSSGYQESGNALCAMLSGTLQKECLQRSSKPGS